MTTTLTRCDERGKSMGYTSRIFRSLDLAVTWQPRQICIVLPREIVDFLFPSLLTLDLRSIDVGCKVTYTPQGYWTGIDCVRRGSKMNVDVRGDRAVFYGVKNISLAMLSAEPECALRSTQRPIRSLFDNNQVFLCGMPTPCGPRSYFFPEV